VCQNELCDCDCDEVEEQLSKLRKRTSVIVQWCTKCDSRYELCECDEPDWVFR